MKLYTHQEAARSFLLEKRRCILADEPRVGKTLPTAAAAIENQPVLVVCPAVAKLVWFRAFEALGCKATIINGRAAAQNLHPVGVAIVNYDLLPYMPLAAGWQTLVLDEVHRVKSPTALRTKAAMALMKVTPRVYALSGTVIPNRIIEIWTILHGLGLYKGNWLKFAYRYAAAWQSPWGLDTSGASNLEELKAHLQPYVMRRTRAQIFSEYKQPVISLVELDLPIDKREKQFDAEAIADSPKMALQLDGLAELMRETGMRKVPLALDFIQGKLDTDPDEPLVLFVWHKDVAAALHKGLQAHNPRLVTGDTTPSAKQAAIDDFQAGRSNVIIGNISTMSEGVDLSRSNTVVFVESTWSTAALQQASARVENIKKQGSAPLIQILTIRDGLDHQVLNKVLKKQNIISQII